MKNQVNVDPSDPMEQPSLNRNTTAPQEAGAERFAEHVKIVSDPRGYHFELDEESGADKVAARATTPGLIIDRPPDSVERRLLASCVELARLLMSRDDGALYENRPEYQDAVRAIQDAQGIW